MLAAVRLPTVRGVDGVVATAAAAVRALVHDAAEAPDALVGVGIGVPGEPLVTAVRAALDAQSAGSEFLASMRIGDRIQLAPRGVPLAAIGAALVGRGTVA